MASLTDDELSTLRRLRARLTKDLADRTVEGVRVPGFLTLGAYYAGTQRLVQLGIAVPEDLRQFVTIVDWPRTFVDAIVSRLRPQGFLVDGVAEQELARVWQANNLDAGIRMSLVDMILYGRGYTCAGTNDEDDKTPIITAESPLQVTHEWSTRRRRVTAAARFYTENEAGRNVAKATLYLPDKTVWLTRGRGSSWDVEDEDPHELGRVPVEPIVNRPTSDNPYGESEVIPIIGLTDAAARALTNAQVATEVMALPQRWAAGMSNADFTDPVTQQAVTAWEAYFGAVWSTPNKDAKFGQFSAADLSNFKTIVELYQELVAGVTGLPMRYFGQNTANPPSADGIRADESRLIGTAEEKQEFAAEGLENMMRTGDRLRTGVVNPDLAGMQTDWRSAATPSTAQAADAAVKLHADGIYSRREALRTMGKTQTQIELIEAEIQAEQADPMIERLLRPATGNGVSAVGA